MIAPTSLPKSAMTKFKTTLRRWLIERAHINWFVKIIIKPRRTFSQIATTLDSVWLPPLLLLTFSAIFLSLSAGSLKQQALSAGEISYPPGFEYYTPEQQAQYLQAAQATSGPVFIYLIPMVGKISTVWLSWLVVSGILHLLVTMLGGRGTNATTVNIVAWSGIPFVLRDILRGLYMQISGSQINMTGLAGFIPISESAVLIYLSIFLAAVDIFLIWNVMLLIVGIDCATRLPRTKVVAGVLLTILLVLGGQAIFGYLLVLLSDLTIVRPFMY